MLLMRRRYDIVARSAHATLARATRCWPLPMTRAGSPPPLRAAFACRVARLRARPQRQRAMLARSCRHMRYTRDMPVTLL